MKGNYSQLTRQVRARLNPENQLLEKSFTDDLSSLSYSDVGVFVRTAMQSPGAAYTQKSIEAGNNAQTHLERELRDAEYKFQGSVMTNTHVSGYSDIDLLVISSKSYFYDRQNVELYLTDASLRNTLGSFSVQKLQNEYNGPGYTEGLTDLRLLRSESERILHATYDICDNSKPKNIRITNQNLHRDVDVVIANWYDDVISILSDKGDNRGVQVYNKLLNNRGNPDFPFLSIRRINERGVATSDRLRKMIRFLKNVRNEINDELPSDQQLVLTSFDINAVCYHIPVSNYQHVNSLQLVRVVFSQLYTICTNQDYADKIFSVDDKEPIFQGKPDKLSHLQKVMTEVASIYTDLQKEISGL